MYPDRYVKTSISINYSGKDKNIQQMFNISVLNIEAHLYNHLVVLPHKAKNTLCSTVNIAAHFSNSLLAQYLTLLSLLYLLILPLQSCFQFHFALGRISEFQKNQLHFKSYIIFLSINLKKQTFYQPRGY